MSKRLLIFLVVPLLLAAATAWFVKSYFGTAIKPGSNQIILFEVAPGSSFKAIARDLANKGFIRSELVLTTLAKITNSGDKKIRFGEYELTQGMRPIQILNKLVGGEILKRKLLVKEGATIKEISKDLETAGIISAQEFESEATNADLLAKAGISAASFEGYLFPNTYYFSRPITARDVIWTMLEEAERRWSKEYSEKAEQLSMTRHDVLTLASIIEKESGNIAEQPVISSVFHNRLTNGMRLQSDPTVIYGAKNYTGDLKQEHLKDASNPYNTYVIIGLPPGPIANPGETAIRAALFPEQSNYLYFVADGQGRHIFSTTLAEHNEAVNRYQRMRNQQQAGAASATPTPALPKADVIIKP